MNQQIKAYLTSKPKKDIGFFPTPLHKLERLSRKLGVELYLKRDDMTGVSLFGGNKIRKLEYLLGDAVEKGCDTVFTFGATQSNHAMETATACRRFGLRPILYLTELVKLRQEDLRSNILLDQILGADVHLASAQGVTEEEADARAVELAMAHKAQLEHMGHKCYVIPTGGATPIGAAGFISGFVEMEEQAEAMGIRPDYLFHGTGTGSTLAGLAAGKVLTGSPVTICSINVSPKPLSHYQKIADMGTEALRYLGCDQTVTVEDLHFDQSYFAPGYEKPNAASTEAIKLLARTEGIFLDPVYTGKGFAGMLDYIRTGRVAKGSTVVFWHTGGATALFAEKQITGSFAEE